MHFARTPPPTSSLPASFSSTTNMPSMESKQVLEVHSTLIELESACSNLRTLLQKSTDLETNLTNMDTRFDVLEETLTNTSRTIAPLQSLAIANKALDTRINRAVSPAFNLLESFKLAESLQEKLLKISSKLPMKKPISKRLKYLIKYVECVDQLNDAIDSISRDCEPATQKLQEVVEFLSRTKATDHYRTRRLKETLVTLKALYETEVDAMRYEGLLDEALLSLQDEYESILQQLKHKNIGDQLQADEGTEVEEISDLGSELEIDVLKRIAETLARNDCLDICIDIFVKVRYTRAAKALMRLNPEYLRNYTPEEIDEMEWESLETAITLWIQHFELAVKTVFVSEKKLCNQVLADLMDGTIWAECFIKIADKIMAVFFRFGEGVTRSSREPQKLFKLLDMFVSLEKLKSDFTNVFEGILSKPESHESLLKDAILNVMEALERNIDSKKLRYKDKVLLQIFSMNTYWYIYMRIRNTELAKLIGEQVLKKNFKTVAEESAYLYQRQAWRPIVRLIEDESEHPNNETTGAVVRGKMEAFMKAFNEYLQRHRSSYNIPDADLREQIRESTVNFVVPAYDRFYNAHLSVLQARSSSFLPPDSIEELLGQIFGLTNPNVTSKYTTRHRSFKDRTAAGENAPSAQGSTNVIKTFRRMNSDD
ncbi:hypothetical protein IFM89_035581 [Coptis chinensis]|uniref:Exocyst subunit Exo70 family protein n=1 Tax=Coptis chinensis TaxID=261450 RepID=A0A835HZW7_9MAGN|nr:hypothetical protein IFM89_035581 [Coptis chinensis]